jgi:mannose-6-phosphate isomerase-like protein (cupin superfamily)
MYTVMLLSLLLAGNPQAPAQAPATQKPPAAPASPAKPEAAPAPRATQPARRAPQRAARSGMAITVTNPEGATLAGVTVEVLGQSDRSGVTNESGQINFTGMQAGTYRVRFTGDMVIAFEREVSVRANQVADVDATLYPAPPPKVVTVAPEPGPAAAVATAAAPGPVGQPQLLSIVDLLDKEFIGRQPRRETLLSCSGDLRTTMIQLNEPQPERLYELSEASYYVLAGEGTVRLDGRDVRLETNGFVSVPRGVAHSFVRRGNRPFVLLATLSGEQCQEPR